MSKLQVLNEQLEIREVYQWIILSADDIVVITAASLNSTTRVRFVMNKKLARRVINKIEKFFGGKKRRKLE